MKVDIDLMEWDITYSELAQWAGDTGAKVYSVVRTSGRNTIYEMDEQDFVAFKLTFKPRVPGNIGYKGPASTADAAYYYCPYIPVITPSSIINIDNIIT